MMEFRKNVRVVYNFQEQMRLWVSGESVHSDHRGLGEECCPDFSCCAVGMDILPLDKRIEIAKKHGVKIAN